MNLVIHLLFPCPGMDSEGYLPTCLHTYLPAYLPACLCTDLPAYLLTYLPHPYYPCPGMEKESYLPACLSGERSKTETRSRVCQIGTQIAARRRSIIAQPIVRIVYQAQEDRYSTSLMGVGDRPGQLTRELLIFRVDKLTSGAGGVGAKMKDNRIPREAPANRDIYVTAHAGNTELEDTPTLAVRGLIIESQMVDTTSCNIC